MTVNAIKPDWPAPPNVRALSTERAGGVSVGPYTSLNLALHVGDVPSAVTENRRRLAQSEGLPAEPRWLRQVHGKTVVHLKAVRRDCEGDAAVTAASDRVCAVLTADCLPVLLTNRDGSVVAAVHAGWRGLASGVLANAVDAMSCDPRALLAWMGPAIAASAYEVGSEVRAAFLARDPEMAHAFARNERGRWQADLYSLARRALAICGVGNVYGGGFCTHTEPGRFFSHRRNAPCGRMATLIWRSD